MRTQIGRRVAQLRASRGDSLRDASARTGVSHTTIARIEKGEVAGSFNSTLHKIADGYGMPVEWLLTGKGGPSDFVTQFQLQAAGQVPVETVTAFVQLMHKAHLAGISPRALDLAIDLMIQQHKLIATHAV